MSLGEALSPDHQQQWSAWEESGSSSASSSCTQSPQLSSIDAIVNCTGLGAKELVPDLEVWP